MRRKFKLLSLTEEHLLFAQQYGFLYLLSIDDVKEVHDEHRVKAIEAKGQQINGATISTRVHRL